MNFGIDGRNVSLYFQGKWGIMLLATTHPDRHSNTISWVTWEEYWRHLCGTR